MSSRKDSCGLVQPSKNPKFTSVQFKGSSLFPHHPGKRKIKRSSLFFNENGDVPAKKPWIKSQKNPLCVCHCHFCWCLACTEWQMYRHTLYMFVYIQKFYLFLTFFFSARRKIPRWVGEEKKKRSGMKIVIFMFIIKEILSPTSKAESFTFQEWESTSHINFFSG